MRIASIFRFFLMSLLAGFVAAALVLTFYREPDPVLNLVTDVGAKAPVSGPASYAGAVNMAAPAVVNIFTTKVYRQSVSPIFNDPFFRHLFGDALRGQTRELMENSLGSGVIVDSKGYIVTNNHVIADADQINVVLNDGKRLEARVVGTDPDSDIAVLKVDSNKLPAITVGDSSNLRVGDVVLAIGNPFGVGQTVTMGIVSATGRNQLGITNFENFIQTDAAINPGNSGGALIDAHGRLVGINTAIFSKTGGSQGIGFAIPVDMVRGIMKQLVETGKVSRGWLGLGGQDVTAALAESFGLKDVQGVLVSNVFRGAAADRAGLRPGDVITMIDDHKVTSAFDIVNAIGTKRPGSEVIIRGWRGEQRLEVRATLDDRDQWQQLLRQ
ncbi:MAG: Do family serine endopeptidase [Chromatiales bacterium]|jgi:serine protease DegS